MPGARSVSVLSCPHSVASTLVPELSCRVGVTAREGETQGLPSPLPPSEARPCSQGSLSPSPREGPGRPPRRHLDVVILAEVGELQVEVGEVETQAVAGGRHQGPALLLVVGILPGEARGCQAPEHGLRPLWVRGCGCRAPQQAQENQQPGAVADGG